MKMKMTDNGRTAATGYYTKRRRRRRGRRGPPRCDRIIKSNRSGMTGVSAINERARHPMPN